MTDPKIPTIGLEVDLRLVPEKLNLEWFCDKAQSIYAYRHNDEWYTLPVTAPSVILKLEELILANQMQPANPVLFGRSKTIARMMTTRPEGYAPRSIVFTMMSILLAEADPEAGILIHKAADQIREITKTGVNEAS